MAAYTPNPSRIREYLKDPRSGYYFFNKAMRNPRVREMLCAPVRLTAPKGAITENIDREIEGLKRDGIYFWDRFLEPTRVEKIRAYLMSKPVHDVHDIERKPLNLSELDPARQVKANYFVEDIAASEDIIRIANDKRILSAVTAYLGCKPTIILMDAWWTKTGTHDQGTLYQDDMYHRDVADFKFIKLFIYLSDVEAENGAHCFVRGSHRSSKLTERKPLTDLEVEASFPAADRLTLTGKAGCGFLEDTWGLHRALPAKKGERLLLSITYSLKAFNPQSPKEPVATNIYGVDRYINRVFLKP